MLGNCVRAVVADENINIVMAHAFFRDHDGIARARELIEIYREHTPQRLARCEPQQRLSAQPAIGAWSPISSPMVQALPHLVENRKS